MASTFNAYRKRDYRTALEAAAKSNVPSFILMRILIAASYGQLGNREAGSKALLKLHADKAGFIALANEWLEKWFDAEMIEHLFEGLRKAGLDIPAADIKPSAMPAPAHSPCPAIAVLPFTNMSINPDDEYFAAASPRKSSTRSHRLMASGWRHVLRVSRSRAGTKICAWLPKSSV